MPRSLADRGRLSAMVLAAGLRVPTGLLFPAGLLMLAGLLGACSQTLPGAPTGSPAVGECHLIVSREQFDAVSDASPPVACWAGHTAQTFKVADVPVPLAGQETRPGPQELKALSVQLCDVPSLRKYLGARERDGTTGLAIAAYAPSRNDWERGARAVRCDVLLTAADGTPRTTSLDLKDVLSGSRSAALRLCYRQEIVNGTLRDDGVDVPCTEPHTAEDISAWFNLDGAGTTQGVTTQAVTTQGMATQDARNARCLPYALQFLGAEALPEGISLRPIIRTAGAVRSVRCALAPVQATPGTVTGTLSPSGGARKDG